MSEDKVCEKSEKCHLFNTPLGGEIIARSYRNQYCYNGHKGRNNCKRYLVSQVLNKVPIDLLPNSRHTVEEIVAKIKKDEELMS